MATLFDPSTLSANLTLSNGNATVTHGAPSFLAREANAIPGQSTGKRAVEFRLNSTINVNGIYIGVHQHNLVNNAVPDDSDGAHWEGNGFVRNSGVLTGGFPNNVPLSYTRIELDCDTGAVEFFSVNSSFFTGNITLTTGLFYPFINILRDGDQLTVEGDIANFNDQPTAGFMSWDAVIANTIDGSLDPQCLDVAQNYIVNIFDETTRMVVGSQVLAPASTDYSINVGTFSGDFVVAAHPVPVSAIGSIASGFGSS